jgi:leucyl-tRNA synthetase
MKSNQMERIYITIRKKVIPATLGDKTPSFGVGKSSRIESYFRPESMPYPFSDIESKWQSYWRANETFRIRHDSAKPKYYVMDMLPYPSGSGLHMGHPMGYTGSDIIARYRRAAGYEVLYPMGWDAFGLPAEQYAVKHKLHPRITTEQNIASFRRQLDALGYSYDWTREINTTDPNYFRWTQWIFLQIFHSYFDETAKAARPIAKLEQHLAKFGTENLPSPLPTTARCYTAKEWAKATGKDREDLLSNFRLAYISEAPVNWCPELGSVLANEEVADQQEKGYTVIRRNMRQWVLRITAYADRLLDDLQLLDWPESTIEMQRNWIGKSIGAEIDFPVQGTETIRVFTTRPDTLFGATYMVLAPEHPLVEKITTAAQRPEIDAYLGAVRRKSDLDRTDLSKEKTGVFTGAFAINPATGKPIPIWIADYVLVSYGTGAIMSVPGHDERDFEFAQMFGLPIVRVVTHQDGDPNEALSEAFSDDGYVVNSGFLDGLKTANAKERMIQWLEEQKLGAASIKYKFRDWLFSRQRYWGEPFPIIFVNDGEGDYPKALPESALPLMLPEVESYSPSGTGESPLATMHDWLNTHDPETGKPARRETNTMPQWAGSCWYYLRYIDPTNSEVFLDKSLEQKWLPVDLYIGGSEHAVTHLLYSRFWHKILFDLGHLSTPEPFKRMFHQGMLLGENGVKMSKSLGNGVNPDDYLSRFGADTLRMYLMFLGPLEMMKPWNSEGINGVDRFLNRIWKLVVDPDGVTDLSRLSSEPPSKGLERLLHQTIKKIGEDIESIRLNTAVSGLMILLNKILDEEFGVPKETLQTFLQLLAPFAPHLSEELWQRLGHHDSIAFAEWPKFDLAKTIEDTVTLVFQINGKLRDKLENVPKGLSREELEHFARTNPRLQKHLEGQTIKKLIVVPDKLVNVVLG